MARDDRSLIDWAISSLTTYPEEWSRNKYRVEHRTGVSVWIANGPTALRLVADTDFSAGPGGLNVLGLLVPWRRKLWFAAKSIPDSAPNPETTARHRIRSLLSGNA